MEAIADLRDWGKEFPELCGKDYVPVKAGFFAVYNKGGDYASPRCSQLSPGWRR